MTTAHDFTARDLGGAEIALDRFRGQVLLVVNTASKCGFTPQYAGLEALHREFGPRGFSVLAFPCNQFGQQEPGDAATIASFCHETYGVTFPVFERIEVNGPGTHPIFAWLKNQRRGLLGRLEEVRPGPGVSRQELADQGTGLGPVALLQPREPRAALVRPEREQLVEELLGALPGGARFPARSGGCAHASPAVTSRLFRKARAVVQSRSAWRWAFSSS